MPFNKNNVNILFIRFCYVCYYKNNTDVFKKKIVFKKVGNEKLKFTYFCYTYNTNNIVCKNLSETIYR